MIKIFRFSHDLLFFCYVSSSYCSCLGECSSAELLHTLAAWHSSVPHHVAILQHTGDSLGAVCLDEALIAGEGHGAAQQEAFAVALPVDGNARIVALVVSECCQGRDIHGQPGYASCSAVKSTNSFWKTNPLVWGRSWLDNHNLCSHFNLSL